MSVAIEKHMCKMDMALKKILKLLNLLHRKKIFCFFSLRQGTIMIAITELLITSFAIFLLLLGATHAQDMVTLVTSHLNHLEESERHSEKPPSFIINNEKKMHFGQHLAFVIMFMVWASLLLTSIHFLSCLLLLYGAIKSSPNFLLPWTITTLFGLIFSSFILLMLAFVPFKCKLQIFALLIVFYAKEIYIWIAIFSFYQELKISKLQNLCNFAYNSNAAKKVLYNPTVTLKNC